MSITNQIDNYFSVGGTLPDVLVSSLKTAALNDPVACLDIANSIRKRLYSSIEAEQIQAIDLLDRLVDSFDLTFHQTVHEKSFLSALEKIVNRDDTVAIPASRVVVDKIKALFSKWVVKFSNDIDLLPNFQVFHARLVEQGILEPLKEFSPPVPGDLPIMFAHYQNESEGQDPEEFKIEVKETIKLFDEVYSNITSNRPTSADDESSRKDALISIATNIDRYSEQFGLWIEQLEPGEYMEEAMRLNDQVTDALQRYKKLRSGVVKSLSYESSDDSETSSDED
jgi:hypothetical protein